MPRLPQLADKTLVAWVSPANLTQQGGSVLTIDDQASHFDGLVFGELTPAVWMAGSDHHHRGLRDQTGLAPEHARPGELIAVALVYHDRQLTLFREGEQYSRHSIAQPQDFGPGAVLLMGLRHLEARDGACFAGDLADVRLYAQALTPSQLAALRPHQPSDPAPLAWWSFADGRIDERIGTFPYVELAGEAAVVDGRLRLTGPGSYLIARQEGGAPVGKPAAARPGDSATWIAAARALRGKLLSDRHRPRYHFVAPEGVAYPFDPNGAIYWRGRYHLCYIFQDHRGHCWGHASSADLVHWTHHCDALAPEPGDPDQGIFSGNAFVNRDGEAMLLYHGVNAGNCLASCSEDDLDHWVKWPGNPIVPKPQPGDPGHGLYESWDPHGWLEGATYYAIFGGRTLTPATLFRSTDLRQWEYLRPIVDPAEDSVEPDEDLSCPDFFPLGDRHMLLCISHTRGCRYYLGDWRDEEFHPTFHGRMNWPGGTCFAPESLVDDRGRRIMWAWALDRRPRPQAAQAGWSGTMTLPRILSLADNGTLRIEPPEELAILRGEAQEIASVGLTPGQDHLLRITGDCLELELTFEVGAAKEVGVVVRRSPDGQEQTRISLDADQQVLRIDVSRASLDTSIVYHTLAMNPQGLPDPPVTAQEAPFALAEGEPLRLRVFLDRSIVEVFANERQCVTQRIYPTREDAVGVALFAVGEGATAAGTSWRMAASNPW